MQIVPKAQAAVATPPNAKVNAQPSGVERAIAKFNEGLRTQAQETPVANPNKVSAEEMSAIKAPSKQEDAGQADTVEASVEEAKPEEPKAEEKKSDLSDRYAMLARREKALRAKDLELKAREAALKPKDAPAPAQPAIDPSKYVSKDLIASDPFAVLSEIGISYDKLVELAVNAPKPEEVAQQQAFKKLEAEIKALKDEQEGVKKNFNDAQRKNYEQAVNQIRVETKNLISNDPEFETIKETGSIEDVVDLIKQTFDKDGVLLTVEEAAKEVEDYLVEEAIKISKIRKIQQKLAGNKPAPSQQNTTVTKQQQPTKTLTNSISGSRQLSARDRAILAFKGELK